MHHQITAKITLNYPDVLAEAPNGSCGIVSLMREHNKNAKPDLTNIVHEEIVDNCFNTLIPRSVTDIMASIYSRNTSPQVFKAEIFYCRFKLLSVKEIL